MTAAVELPTVTPASAAENRAAGRVVELASGLLMLLDEHHITGRLPLDARVQASRLRHAVKLAVQTAAARSSSSSSSPPAPASPDPASQLREWIAAQPWAQPDPGPPGFVYLLCFRDPTSGEHQPLRGNGCRGQYAGHYWGKAASSGLLRGLRRVRGREFAELSWLTGPLVVLPSAGWLDPRGACESRSAPSPAERPASRRAGDDPGHAGNLVGGAGCQPAPTPGPPRPAPPTPSRPDPWPWLLSARQRTLQAECSQPAHQQIAPAAANRSTWWRAATELRSPAGSGRHAWLLCGDPEHDGPPRVQESQRRGALPDKRTGISASHQESRRALRARRPGRLSRDNPRAGISTARTNSRLLQHWTEDLVRRITREHRNPKWAGPGRLVQVALAAGLTFELAWVEYPATRGRERRLKNQGGAARRCPLCRGTAGPLDPFQAAAAVRDPTTGRRR